MYIPTYASVLNPPTSTDIPDYTADIPEFAMCDEHTACPNQEHCHKGQCVSCVLCDGWNRRPAPSINGTSCAKSEAECGICLPGFQGNDLTRVGQMITCSPNPTPLNSYDEGPFVFDQNYFNVGLSIAVLFLYIWVFCAPRLKKFIRNICKKLNLGYCQRNIPLWTYYLAYYFVMLQLSFLQKLRMNFFNRGNNKTQIVATTTQTQRIHHQLDIPIPCQMEESNDERSA